jgi:hypothetical protein
MRVVTPSVISTMTWRPPLAARVVASSAEVSGSADVNMFQPQVKPAGM